VNAAGADWETHRVPEVLRVHSPNDVAAWIGEESRWQRAQGRYEHLVARWPVLRSSLPRYFDVLADYVAVDFHRLEAMLGGYRPTRNPPVSAPVTCCRTRQQMARDTHCADRRLAHALRDSEAEQADFHDLAA